MVSVKPTAIERIKLFPPSGVPVTGPDALCGPVGGPWDQLTVSVRNHYVYQSIEAYLDGVPWSETQLYDHPKYKDNPDRARRRCEKIERLIDSIGERGYQRQDEEQMPSKEMRLESPNEWIGEVYVGDEIIIGLDRSGAPVHLKNGRHRLAVAQLMDIGRIPVILSLYHPRAKMKVPDDAVLIHSE